MTGDDAVGSQRQAGNRLTSTTVRGRLDYAIGLGWEAIADCVDVCLGNVSDGLATGT